MHQDHRENDIQSRLQETLVGPLSGLPPTDGPSGPRRKAPRYYAGETYGGRMRSGAQSKGALGTVGGRAIQHPDVERNKNGSLPGIRNKAARRLIRNALKRKYSSVEQALGLPRAMKAQAREVASEEHVEKIADYHTGNRSTKFASTSGETRWARRLFASELAIHRPVYAPDQKTLRAMRTAKRKEKRKGKKDFITAAIEQLAEKQP